MPGALLLEWQKWLDNLQEIAKMNVPRCLKPLGFKILSASLHHFADASQRAHGAATYIRLIDAEGNIHCNFLVAKAKLSPIKGMTIPRLELMAAVEAVKLDILIKRELDLPLQSSVFWSDCTIVLWYIYQMDKRYQTFVANRVGFIHDHTSPEQWRHVDSERNPADDTSRGLSASDLVNSSRWLCGPCFLQKPINYWPPQPDFGFEQTVEAEVKREMHVNAVQPSSLDNSVSTLFSHYSSWYRLQKAIAWLLRLKSILLHRDHPVGLLKVSELRLARTAIVKHMQGTEFGFEIAKIAKGRLRKLSPIFTPDGLLCVGGRLQNSSVGTGLKHPWIIPGDNHVTTLIIRHYHALIGHAGVERVLSGSRQAFCILHGRLAVKRQLRSCLSCRKAKATPLVQIMADLPTDRVTPGDPPFTWVGVDYFGPLIVKRGRTEHKRYECLFTCLTTRAIHLEVSQSLDTDSFINALERFVELRGRPKRIRSDNGTNFVGAKKELRRALAEWTKMLFMISFFRKRSNGCTIPQVLVT